MKIFITGSKGQLGTELQKVLKHHQLFLGDVENCDITKPDMVFSRVYKFRPEVIIHAAAYTDVDGAETHQDLAYRVNALGTRNVVVATELVGAKIVYISTDYVFDGKKGKPYLEFDKPNPLSVYGKSKLAGEYAVQHLTKKYFIARSAWLYGENGKNFVKTILELAKKEKELKVVRDQIGSPTWAYNLAEAIGKLIESDLYGVYHITNSGQASWYDFACEILKLKEIKVKVNPVRTKEFPRSAPRPPYSVLDNFNLKEMGIFKMPNWRKALKDFLNKDFNG